MNHCRALFYHSNDGKLYLVYGYTKYKDGQLRFAYTFFSIISLFLHLFLLKGCTDHNQAENELRSYLADLYVAFEQPADLNQIQQFTAKLSRYPTKKALQLTTEKIRIGFFDFLTMDACRLPDLIAERNSNLGKLMAISQQLHWEHRFIVEIQNCLEADINGPQRIDPDLKRQLSEILRIKKRDLPNVFWNATFGSPEFQQLFSMSVPVLSIDTQSGSIQQTVTALNYFTRLAGRIGQRDYAIDEKEMEEQYYQLQRGREGMSVLKSIELSTFYLERANTLINKYEEYDKGPLKFRLQDVFQRTYQKKIQPYLAVVHQQGQRLLKGIDQLYQQQRIDPPAEMEKFYRYYLALAEEKGLWQTFNRAIKEHVKAWQPVLKQ